MLKSQPPQHTPTGNAKKYLSYREAWTRIKKAQEHGFYLEAVTIAESIISDRLISYLVHVEAIKRRKHLRDYPSLNDLIQQWKKYAFSDTCQKLQEDAHNWRLARNRIVHGMVRSHPGTATTDVVDFLEEARLAAVEGARIARAISVWCDRAKRASQSNTSNTTNLDG